MKTAIVANAFVKVTFDNGAFWNPRQSEGDAGRRLEHAAKLFEDFVRDHKSLDDVSITIVKERKEICSLCGREWEEDQDGPLCCSGAQSAHEALSDTAR